MLAAGAARRDLPEAGVQEDESIVSSISPIILAPENKWGSMDFFEQEDLMNTSDTCEADIAYARCGLSRTAGNTFFPIGA